MLTVRTDFDEFIEAVENTLGYKDIGKGKNYGRVIFQYRYICKLIAENNGYLWDYAYDEDFDDQLLSHYKYKNHYDDNGQTYVIHVFIDDFLWEAAKNRLTDEVFNNSRYKECPYLVPNTKTEFVLDCNDESFENPVGPFLVALEKLVAVKLDTTTLTLCDFMHKACEFVCDYYDMEWPFNSTREFNRNMYSYEPLKPFLVDRDTRQPKVKIEFSESLKTAINNMFPPKNKKDPIIEPNRKEKYENAPVGDGSTFENYNFILENNPVLKMIPELVNVPSKTWVLFIKAPCGAGKTGVLVAFLKKLLPINSILSITGRISLAYKQESDFEELGFVTYEKQLAKNMGRKINLHDTKRVICQVDSICKIINPADYLILDEIETIFQHVFSSPFIQKKLAMVIDRLIQHIKEARHVIIADAYLSEQTVDFIKHTCGRDDIIVYQNTHIRNYRKLHYFDGTIAMQDDIIEKLKQGFNIFVATNSNKFAEELYYRVTKEVPGCKAKIYNKNTPMKMDKNGKPCDPAADFINQNLAIVTPKLQAGNSFVANHFHYKYGYATPCSSPPNAFAQLFERVRILENENVYICVTKFMGSKTPIPDIKTMGDLEQFYLNKFNDCKKVDSYKLSTNEIYNIKYDLKGQVNLNDPITRFLFYMRFVINKGLEDYDLSLISYFKSAGYAYGGCTKIDTAVAKTREKQGKSINKHYMEEAGEIHANKLNKTKILSFDEHEELRVKMRTTNEVTEDDKLQLEKYKLYISSHILYAELPKGGYDAVRAFGPIRNTITKCLPILYQGNIEKEKTMVNMVLRNLSGEEPMDPENRSPDLFDIHQSTKMNITAKAIVKIINILRELGFKYSIFDPNVVKINIKRAWEVLNSEDSKKLLEIYKRDFSKEQIKEESIIKKINYFTRIIFQITVEATRNVKGNTLYKIIRNWIFYQQGNKLIIKLYPYETDFGPDKYCEQFNNNIQQIMTFLNNTYININLGFNGNPRCCVADPTFEGGYHITNVYEWEKYINSDNSEAFQKIIIEIYKGYRLLKSYMELLDKVDNTMTQLTWSEYYSKYRGVKMKQKRKQLSLRADK